MPPVMGHRPEVETHLLRMLRKLRKGRAHAKFAILYGPRGNGKTVLLTWLETQAAGESITCASLMPENLQTDGALARALEAAAGHPAIVRNILQSLDFTISAGMAGVSAQLGVRDKETDPARQIARMTLLITLDEAHRVVPSQLARLMDAVQAAGKTSPVALSWQALPDSKTRYVQAVPATGAAPRNSLSDCYHQLRQNEPWPNRFDKPVFRLRTK